MNDGLKAYNLGQDGAGQEAGRCSVSLHFPQSHRLISTSDQRMRCSVHSSISGEQKSLQKAS